MSEEKTVIYVATMSRVRGQLDRVSFSQIVNHLAERDADLTLDQGHFDPVHNSNIPENHILHAWVEDLEMEGMWCDWMMECNDVSLYHMEYRASTEEVPMGPVEE